MRRIVATLLLSGLLGALSLALAPTASACSCVPRTTAQHLERADAVFSARLLSSGVLSSADLALHVFAVDTVFTGTAHAEQGVLSPLSGASCGLELAGDGPFVVFATRSPDLGGTPVARLAEDGYASLLCDGTAPATPELVAELRALVPEAAGAPLPGRAGTTAPGPGPWGPALAGAGALALLATGVLLVRRRRRSSPGALRG